MVDRFIEWPEVVPLPNANAEIVALWDKGRQLELSIWSQLMRILGTHRIETTAYHHIANRLVKRQHCQKKPAIKCVPSPTDWVSGLLWILLGICTAMIENIGSTSA
uniref:Uncharacterized protein n=1 Tax=Amphimedon queenslandica TaxID=400682 RepID=A0A1X7VDI8_AMPQE